MPKIPNISPQIPTQQVDRGQGAISTGSIGSGLAQLGAGVANFSSNLMKMRKAAQAQDYALKGLDLVGQVRQFAAEQKLKVPENADGYSEAVKNYINENYSQLQQDAPSPAAKDALIRSVRTHLSSAYQEAQAYEFQTKAKSYVLGIKSQIDKNSADLINSPTDFGASDTLDYMNTQIDKSVGTILSAQQAKDLKDYTAREIPNGLLEGYFQKGQYDTALGLLMVNDTTGTAESIKSNDFIEYTPKEALAANLISEDEAKKLEAKNATYKQPINSQVDFSGLGFESRSKVLSGLTADDRFKWIMRFKNALKNSAKTDLSTLHARVEDTQYQLLSNPGSVPRSELSQLQMDIQTNKSLNPEQKARLLDGLNAYKSVGIEAGLLPSTPSGEMDSVIQNTINKVNQKGKLPGAASSFDAAFNARLRGSLVNQYLRLGEQHIKARNADPVQYLLDFKSDIPGAEGLSNQFLGGDPSAGDRLLNKERALGVKEENVRLLSKAQASNIVHSFTSQANPKGAAQLMDFWQKRTGSNQTRFFNELEKAGLPPAYQIAMYLPDERSKEAVLDNAMNGKAIREDFKKNNPKESSDLMAAVSEKTQDFRAAIHDTGIASEKAALANEFQNQVYTQAARYRTGGLEIDAATQRAFDDVLGRSFSTVNAADSHVLVPRESSGVKNDPSKIEDLMKAAKTSKAFEELQIKVPADPNSHIPPAERKHIYYNQLEENGFWRTTPTGNGIILKFRDAEGRVKNVEDVNGNPIIFYYNRISKGQQDTFIEKHKKGFLGIF